MFDPKDTNLPSGEVSGNTIPPATRRDAFDPSDRIFQSPGLSGFVEEYKIQLPSGVAVGFSASTPSRVICWAPLPSALAIQISKLPPRLELQMICLPSGM